MKATNEDTQSAVHELLASLKTAPMTLDELSRVFGLNRNLMREMLGELEAEPFRSRWRIPIRHMPVEYVARHLGNVLG